MYDLSTVLDAIAHPARRAMLSRLVAGPARVTEIAEPFEFSLNAASKHIKVLEGAGLVRREKHGRDHVIEIRPEPLREVSAWVHEYEKYWTERLDRLESHFRKRKKAKKP